MSRRRFFSDKPTWFLTRRFDFFFDSIIAINPRRTHRSHLDTTSQSDVSKKNRLEQLVPSSKVIVARKHSGLEIAKVDSVAGWHTFSENLWRGQRARTDQWNRLNAGTRRLKNRLIAISHWQEISSFIAERQSRRSPFHLRVSSSLLLLEERFVSQQSRKRPAHESRRSTDRCLNSKRFYLSISYDFDEREFPVEPYHDESVQLPCSKEGKRSVPLQLFSR